MRSILKTGLKLLEPNITTAIPDGYSPFGLPFCVESDTAPTAFQLIPQGASTGYPLDIAYIEDEGGLYYYNANIDLVAALNADGYYPKAGRYYFSMSFAGGVTFSNIFYLDILSELPTPLGDFNDDFNDDFLT